MTSALLVADYIIGTSDSQLTPMKINKLAYISHGFTLALEHEPLFEDKAEAWKYGPVIPSIYHSFKRYGGEVVPMFYYCSIPLASPKRAELMTFLHSVIPDRHASVINDVLLVYGKYSGPGLSTITHEEGTPWDQCRRAGKLGVEIPNEITGEYYRRQLEWPARPQA